MVTLDKPVTRRVKGEKPESFTVEETAIWGAVFVDKNDAYKKRTGFSPGFFPPLGLFSTPGFVFHPTPPIPTCGETRA